jgi:hypothetical protein
MTDDKPLPPPENPPVSADAAKAKADDDGDLEPVDVYTAEVACKCGKQLAANAWFCPRCGRVYLLNMLFALVVLATSFALMTHLVSWILLKLTPVAQHKP